jgi:hypothetical protein
LATWSEHRAWKVKSSQLIVRGGTGLVRIHLFESRATTLLNTEMDTRRLRYLRFPGCVSALPMQMTPCSLVNRRVTTCRSIWSLSAIWETVKTGSATTSAGAGFGGPGSARQEMSPRIFKVFAPMRGIRGDR